MGLDAIQWNPLDGIGRIKGRLCETWRRNVERECNNLNNTWSDMKRPGPVKSSVES